MLLGKCEKVWLGEAPIVGKICRLNFFSFEVDSSRRCYLGQPISITTSFRGQIGLEVVPDCGVVAILGTVLDFTNSHLGISITNKVVKSVDLVHAFHDL